MGGCLFAAASAAMRLTFRQKHISHTDACWAPAHTCSQRDFHCQDAPPGGFLTLLGVLLQVKHKYNGMMADIFKETFWWLPLAHVLNRRVLVVHGGLFSQDGVKLDDIRAVNRYRWAQHEPEQMHMR